MFKEIPVLISFNQDDGKRELYFRYFVFTYDKLNKTMDYENMESRSGYYCRWYGTAGSDN